MNDLTLASNNQVTLLIAPRAAREKMLSLVAKLALAGPLLLLDCGNRANPVRVARELRYLTQDPVAALHNIRTARAFTCYQVTVLLEEAAAQPHPRPALVLDMLATFYDESVTRRESRRLLAQAVEQIEKLRLRAPVVISARPPPPEFAERAGLLAALIRIADNLWEEDIRQDGPPQQPSLF